MKCILVANRGEIGVRIVKACRDLGIRSVAIYSEADRNSLHVRLADQAVKIGPSSVTSSYLSQPAILHTAVSCGCNAIHPGYGFLAENPEFAKACEEEGLLFIGPSPQTIQKFGDKSQARAEAAAAGVPVVPGSEDSFTTLTPALKEARRVGFPILIKARSGGGGRGMRVANNESEFTSLFPQATAEAASAFGDESMYIEKYLTKIRHVEVQILGDNYGNIQALGERDCTVQRRHQKLVEEAPCVVVSEITRRKMIDAAIRLGKSIGYKGLGTVEYVLCEDLETFYFIEMNTRIQVEHPVTEAIFGIDLVRSQIQLAMGHKLSDVIENANIDGHAIEFRINAENWKKDFLPSPGLISRWSPAAGTGIRVDSHVYESFRIEPFYDSMIAKLVVHGDSREQALKRAGFALDQFVVEGIDTTIGFHQKLLKQQQFVSGDIATNWVESRFLTES